MAPNSERDRRRQQRSVNLALMSERRLDVRIRLRFKFWLFQLFQNYNLSESVFLPIKWGENSLDCLNGDQIR